MLMRERVISRMGIVALLGLFSAGLLLGGCETSDEEVVDTASEESSGSVVIEVSSEDFEREVLQAETLVVVDFWAEWCAPCNILKPTLDELAQEYAGKVKFASLDVDENTAEAKQYDVAALPSLVFFRDGREVHRIVGVQSKGDLKSGLDKLLAE